MRSLILSDNRSRDFLQIPVNFIDEFMPQAPEDALKVYLYLLRAVQDPSIRVSITDMADLLDRSPSAIQTALRYWENCGLMSLNYENGELCSLSLRDSFDEPQNTSVDAPVPEAHYRHLPETTMPEPQSGSLSAEVTPAPEEELPYDQHMFDNDPAFTELLNVTQYYVGAPLTSVLRDALSFSYFSLNRDYEIAEYLVEYCIDKKGKLLPAYMTTVAEGWKQSGFRTVSEVKASCDSRSKNLTAIMNAFGLKTRLTTKQQEMVDRWCADFDLSLILLASDRSIEYTGAPDMFYADSVLSRWKTAGVHTVSEAEEENRRFHEQKARETQKRPEKHQSGPQKPNLSFRNFKERDTDYNALLTEYYKR